MTPGGIPTGFTKNQWSEFLRNGFLIIENAVPDETLKMLDAGVHELRDIHGFETSLRLSNVVAKHKAFENLIDFEKTIGYAYDIYGESLKLLSSEMFVRLHDAEAKPGNPWHFDGPRLLPFSNFDPVIPMRLKIGIWLTDTDTDNKGNLAIIPNSHKIPYINQYQTHNQHSQEKILHIKRGSILLMYAGLWHRVLANTSNTNRINFYLEYGPSWLQASDRSTWDDKWFKDLTRTQQIIMRHYIEPNYYFKPPDEDVPVFEGSNPEPSYEYAANIPTSLRQYKLRIEKFKA